MEQCRSDPKRWLPTEVRYPGTRYVVLVRRLDRQHYGNFSIEKLAVRVCPVPVCSDEKLGVPVCPKRRGTSEVPSLATIDEVNVRELELP